MSELGTKIEDEVEDFTDELSDEALDRVEGTGVFVCASGSMGGRHCGR
jgi:hypothetical protein